MVSKFHDAAYPKILRVPVAAEAYVPFGLCIFAFLEHYDPDERTMKRVSQLE
jgi:hypothetical protein